MERFQNYKLQIIIWCTVWIIAIIAESTVSTYAKPASAVLPDEKQPAAELVWEDDDTTLTAVSSEDAVLGVAVAGKYAYTAPEDYYAPRFTPVEYGLADYDLKPGTMGLKVRKVQRYLGSGDRKGYYRSATQQLVGSFQKENGLPVTNVVDKATWLKMGFTEDDWNYLGIYVAPILVNEDSTYQDYIDKFIETAFTYNGDQYLVGACGKPGEGVDCSGLVLECMYATGIFPDGLSPIQHSTEEEYNSYRMWLDPKLKNVDKEDLMPGDLIFYDMPSSSARPIDHIAIYIGDGRIIEAMDGVATAGLDRTARGYTYVGAKRIFYYDEETVKAAAAEKALEENQAQ